MERVLTLLPHRWRARQPEMLFPNLYVWLLFASALDAMFTWMILNFGGSEVNPIANAVLGSTGFTGMTLFKFALVTLFIIACEEVGRTRPVTGRRLAIAGIAISFFPVLFALPRLLNDSFHTMRMLVNGW